MAAALTRFGSNSLKWPVIFEEPKGIPGPPQQGGVLITVKFRRLVSSIILAHDSQYRIGFSYFLAQNSTLALHSHRSRPKPGLKIWQRKSRTFSTTPPEMLKSFLKEQCETRRASLRCFHSDWPLQRTIPQGTEVTPKRPRSSQVVH